MVLGVLSERTGGADRRVGGGVHARKLKAALAHTVEAVVAARFGKSVGQARQTSGAPCVRGPSACLPESEGVRWTLRADASVHMCESANAYTLRGACASLPAGCCVADARDARGRARALFVGADGARLAARV